MKGFLGIPLSFPPLNLEIEVGNSSFLGILDSFPKHHPVVGDERKFRVRGMIQRMNKRKNFSM